MQHLAIDLASERRDLGEAGPRLVRIGAALGVIGLFFAAIAWRMPRQSLIPERDPRLAESLMFENV